MLVATTAVMADEFSGSFRVNGDADKFYPVTFYDGMWDYNQPTKLYLSRHNIHMDNDWHDSLSASFEFHVTHWGHGSNYINADVRQFQYYLGDAQPLIAGWDDVTRDNGTRRIVIWLKGQTTYNYHCNTNPFVEVYDGAANSLPYSVQGFTADAKTTVDDYVDSYGRRVDGRYVRVNPNGNVGIGTANPDAKLTVNGTVHAKEVLIDLNGPLADYIFDPGYALPSLTEVKKYIEENKHLPDMPSAAQVEKGGMSVGEMQNLLLQKIEELTLYTLEQQREIEKLKALLNAK